MASKTRTNWRSADKARERELKAGKTRAAEIRDRLMSDYGIDTSLSPREKEKGKKDRRKQSGFRSSVRDFGGWGR